MLGLRAVSFLIWWPVALGHVTNSDRGSKLVGCRHRHILHARARHTGDQASSALEGNVIPCPIHRNDNTIAEPYQKIDVGDAPQQPCQKAVELDAPNLHNGA